MPLKKDEETIGLAGAIVPSLILQPGAFFLFAHRAFFDGFGEGLFLWALLLAARGVARLTTIEGKGRLAVVEQRTELFGGDLKETGQAFELLFAQADQFDGTRFKFFPHVDAEPQAPGRTYHGEATLRTQFLEIGRCHL